MPTTQEHISTAGVEFKKAIDYLKTEYSRLQMGRASPALVENLNVEAYGGAQPLKSLASISVPDAKTLQIQPWDASILGAIEKAIKDGDLGLNPVNDGRAIRLPMPPLTEERRKELAKVVGQMAEKAKISVRTARGTAHGAFRTMEEKKEITEDERRHSEKQLQEKVDSSNKEIEEAAKKKGEEVMTV